MPDLTDAHAPRRYTVTFTAQPWQPDTFADAIREQVLLLPGYVERISVTAVQVPQDPNDQQ